ncbi:hypothetical protein J6590_043317 [Homalodisca vitripennis]|nr:hypothetical protein J6590_043317 [Homalodisca vitripennis]
MGRTSLTIPSVTPVQHLPLPSAFPFLLNPLCGAELLHSVRPRPEGHRIHLWPYYTPAVTSAPLKGYFTAVQKVVASSLTYSSDVANMMASVFAVHRIETTDCRFPHHSLDNYHTARHRTIVHKRLPSQAGAQFVNILPNSIKSANMPKAFKARLKSALIKAAFYNTDEFLGDR